MTVAKCKKIYSLTEINVNTHVSQVTGFALSIVIFEFHTL